MPDKLEHARDVLDQVFALLQASLENSPSGILIADAPDVTIRWANQAALKLRGDSDQAPTGLDVNEHPADWQLFRPDGSPYPPDERPLARAIIKGEFTHGEEFIIRNARGEDRWV